MKLLPLAPRGVAASGNLFGTTYSGGTFGYGIVDQLSPPATLKDSGIIGWTENVLYNFPGGNDGAVPMLGW